MPEDPQKALDTDQGLSDLEQAVLDRQQGISDRQQADHDRRQSDFQQAGTPPTTVPEQARRGHTQAGFDAIGERLAHQQAMHDDIQEGREGYQELLDAHQESMDQAIGDRSPEQVQALKARAEGARRRAVDSARRATAAAARATAAEERAEAGDQRRADADSARPQRTAGDREHASDRDKA